MDVRVKPGAFAPSLPTEPDVKISLIRFLRIHKLYARALPDRSHSVWRITLLPNCLRNS